MVAGSKSAGQELVVPGPPAASAAPSAWAAVASVAALRLASRPTWVPP